MMGRAAALLALAAACGSAPNASKAPALSAPQAVTSSCNAPEEALEFASHSAADTSEPLAEIDADKVETLATGLGLGSSVEYARWGPTGDLLIAVSGCEEGECSAGVVLAHRNDHGFFVKKTDTALPAVHGSDVTLTQVFIANLIGDEAPEFWVAYTTYGDGEDDAEEQHVAAYSLSGLSLLWSKTLLSRTDAGCSVALRTMDLGCDGLIELGALRTCAEAPNEDAVYHWSGGRMRLGTPPQVAPDRE